MTDIRDKIAEIIHAGTKQALSDYDVADDVIRNDPEIAAADWATADAIMAAMPDMVAPLVWEEHPSKAFWRCDAGFGIYKVYGMGGKPSWDFDGLTVQVSLMAESVDAAKAAANAHNAAAVVAAFTGSKQ